MTRVTYVDSFEAATGASGTRDIKEMPVGQSFTLEKATVYGEGSFDNRVDVQILYGSERVLPRSGSLAAFNTKQTGVADRTYESGTAISVYYDNQDAAAAHNVLIVLEGEEFTDHEV